MPEHEDPSRKPTPLRPNARRLLELSTPELVIALVACVVGAVVQGSIGFGFGLIVIPVLILTEPSSLPAGMLILSLPMTIWMAFRERSAIDVRGFVEIIIARLPGTGLAVVVLGVVSGDGVSVVIGAAIIVAVLLSAFGPEFELRTRWRLLAGLFSGFMGTVAAIGGPPLAIAYQRRPGPELRSTMALSFAVGSIVSLIAIGVAGHVERSHAVLALTLLPGLVAGLVLSARVHRFIDRGWLRPAVLVFAGLSGVLAIVEALL